MVYHSKGFCFFRNGGGEKSFFLSVCPYTAFKWKRNTSNAQNKIFLEVEQSKGVVWNMNRKRSFFKMKIKRVGRHTPVACVDSGHPPSQT